jgi:hypothetical protein
VETSWKNEANGAKVALTVTSGLAFSKSSMTFCQPAWAVAGKATFRVPEAPDAPAPVLAVVALSSSLLPQAAITVTAASASTSAATRRPGRPRARRCSTH